MHNIDDFGAVGDGVKDCTASMQAALDAANLDGGGSVFIPQGVFLTNGLTVGSKTTVFGEGVISVVKMIDSARECLFRNKDVVGGNSNITFRDFALDGNAENQPPGSGKGISLFNAHDCKIKRIETVAPFYLDAIYIGGSAWIDGLLPGGPCEDIVIRDCTVHSWRCGIAVTRGKRIKILFNTVRNCGHDLDEDGYSDAPYWTAAAVDIEPNETTDDANAIIIHGNHIYDNCETAIAVMGNAQTYGIIITNNVLDNCINGIMCQGIDVSALAIHGNVIIGMYKNYDIRLSGQKSVSVMGNITGIVPITNAGIRVEDDASDISVIGNVMKSGRMALIGNTKRSTAIGNITAWQSDEAIMLSGTDLLASDNLRK